VPLFTHPSARALRCEDIRRAIPQAQITNLDRVLDCHAGSVRVALERRMTEIPHQTLLP
jgi:hypothetical protein